MSARRFLLSLLAMSGLCSMSLPAEGQMDQIHERFLNPPDESRMMVRWWWFGPAVTREGIDRELAAMKAGGIGGVEVQPTYPLILDDPTDPAKRNIRWMSPEFLDLLKYTAAKCNEMNIRMDLTLGSGWPYGGPMFSASEGAGRLEIVVVRANAGQKSIKVPAQKEGHTVFAAFLANKELSIESGEVQLPDQFAGGDITFFISGRTGMQVKRPAFGAEGNVIDHLSKSVVEKFIREVGEPEVKACGENPPYAIFCDSLEVGGENWTDDFLNEFKKRRGYDLRPNLPALIHDIGEKTSAIRHDYAQTLTDVLNDNFNSQFKALAEKYHTRFRVQGYGSPAFGMYSHLYTDLAEGEAGGNGNWQSFRTTRSAACANHLLGRPVTSSETFTWLHAASFRATPIDIKGEVDTHFLDGVNQIVCHGWPYTPAGVGYPGTSFYAAAVFNDKIPWYHGMPEISRYIARISQLLREGSPANDVALYLANSDHWSHADIKYSSMNAVATRNSNLLAKLLRAGYNLDAFDDGILTAKGKIADGQLQFGDLKYKVIVLPGVESISLSTARLLEQFVQQGGQLFATQRLPEVVPGMTATEQDQKELAGIIQRLFVGPIAKAKLIESENDLPAAIRMHLLPDISLDQLNTDFGFVHRHANEGEIYFLANTMNLPMDVSVTFRVGDLNPELWDVQTGKASPLAAIQRSGDSRKTIRLSFEPYESKVVVWTSRKLPVEELQKPSTQDISASWSVAFHSENKVVGMAKLNSWIRIDSLKNFSGVATYEKTVNITGNLSQKCKIDFGPVTPISTPQYSHGYVAQVYAPVCDAAVVYVNGKRAGAAWCSPYQVDVSDLLKPGENQIRIEVGNTPVNQLARDGFPNYDLDAVRREFGTRFDPQNTQLLTEPLPSGLMGPIQLIWGDN